jgi:hypothetical protein
MHLRDVQTTNRIYESIFGVLIYHFRLSHRTKTSTIRLMFSQSMEQALQKRHSGCFLISTGEFLIERTKGIPQSLLHPSGSAEGSLVVRGMANSLKQFISISLSNP